MNGPVAMVWRRARPEDATALRDLERAANVVALAHVFPADEHPFPDRDVLARWRDTLADPGVVVEVVDGPAGLLAYVAYDAGTVRHLAVDPDRWGSGWGRAAVERATAAMAEAGADAAYLWVLDANLRARGLYARLGWIETGETRSAEWPPYPSERRLRTDLTRRATHPGASTS